MDIAYELVVWLQRMGFGTINTDLFVGQIPANTSGVWTELGGGSLNNYVPIEESVVDIYCKNMSSETCVEKLNNIKRAIHRMHTTEINDTYIYTFLVIGDITVVSRDPEYAKIYKLTVQVVHRDTGVIS